MGGAAVAVPLRAAIADLIINMISGAAVAVPLGSR